MEKNKNQLEKNYETEKRKKALRMIEQWIIEFERQCTNLEVSDECREEV